MEGGKEHMKTDDIFFSVFSQKKKDCAGFETGSPWQHGILTDALDHLNMLLSIGYKAK